MSKKEKAPTFENFEVNLESLEKIVEELESGKLTLGESLKKFEKGVKLYQGCKDQLVYAQNRITELTDNLTEQDIE